MAVGDEQLQPDGEQREEDHVDVATATSHELCCCRHGAQVGADVEDVRDEQDRDQERHDRMRKDAPQVLAEACPCDPADVRADQLHCSHQRIGEDHGPQQAVAELRARLGVSGDAAGIVVRGAGHDARTDVLADLDQAFLQALLGYSGPLWRQSASDQAGTLLLIVGAVRMAVMIEPGAQAIRGELARRVLWESERLGERSAQQRIAKRTQHERQGCFRHLVLFVTDSELGNEAADGIEDGIERIAIAGEDHPGGKRPGALAAEGVEGLVDDVARVRFAGASALHGVGNAGNHGLRDRPRKFGLEAGRGSEMMEEVGVRPADPRRDRL